MAQNFLYYMNESLTAREVIIGRNHDQKLFMACTICPEQIQCDGPDKGLNNRIDKRKIMSCF